MSGLRQVIENMAGVEGLEPPNLGLEIRCSILLSYTPEVLFDDSGRTLEQSNLRTFVTFANCRPEGRCYKTQTYHATPAVCRL